MRSHLTGVISTHTHTHNFYLPCSAPTQALKAIAKITTCSSTPHSTLASDDNLVRLQIRLCMTKCLTLVRPAALSISNRITHSNNTRFEAGKTKEKKTKYASSRRCQSKWPSQLAKWPSVCLNEVAIHLIYLPK